MPVNPTHMEENITLGQECLGQVSGFIQYSNDNDNASIMGLGGEKNILEDQTVA